MRDTYSIQDFQRKTAAVIRRAESGVLVTLIRKDRPVVHVISSERLGGILETMELLAEPAFMKRLKLLRSGRLKFHAVSSLAD